MIGEPRNNATVKEAANLTEIRPLRDGHVNDAGLRVKNANSQSVRERRMSRYEFSDLM